MKSYRPSQSREIGSTYPPKSQKAINLDGPLSDATPKFSHEAFGISHRIRFGDASLFRNGELNDTHRTGGSSAVSRSELLSGIRVCGPGRGRGACTALDQ